MTDNLKDLTTEEEHYDETPRTLEALAELAVQRNCDIVVADDTVLLIDLDSDEALGDFHDNLNWYNEREWLGEAAFWKSRSGGTHVQINLVKPRPPIERVLLQRLLGSDPVREALTYLRICKTGSDPIVLFRPKDNKPQAFYGPDYDDLPF